MLNQEWTIKLSLERPEDLNKVTRIVKLAASLGLKYKIWSRELPVKSAKPEMKGDSNW